MSIITIILLIVGFLFLIKGADIFVEGASDLATKFKIPSIIIGLTIVAFGTSLPEAAVSVTSGINHLNAIAISNVVGSNIFNLLGILGITALMSSITLKEDVVHKDFPVLILSSIILLIFAITGNQISRIEGIVLLISIVGYVGYLIIKSQKNTTMPVSISKLSTEQVILYILLGLGGVIIGGNLVVNSATEIALACGMSETLVGLTIVAIGTSLPELVTSITAIKSEQPDIAVGNIVGSNIFNILFILGLTDTISPIKTDGSMIFDITIMTIITLITFYLAKDKSDFNRRDGMILFGMFIIYMIFIILRN